MMLISKIKDYFGHRTVYVHDKFYDYMINNNGLHDSKSIVKVTYSKFRGIIKIEATSRVRESDVIDIHKFYNICNIDAFGGMREHKKYTLYCKV